jgi:hypothetical protein
MYRDKYTVQSNFVRKDNKFFKFLFHLCDLGVEVLFESIVRF